MVCYEKVMVVRVWEKEKEKKINSYIKIYWFIVYSLFLGFIMYGDINRDGKVDEIDKLGRENWFLLEGVLMLFNNDDDNGDLILDWWDGDVNGENDVVDLVIVNIWLVENYRDV